MNPNANTTTLAIVSFKTVANSNITEHFAPRSHADTNPVAKDIPNNVDTERSAGRGQAVIQ